MHCPLSLLGFHHCLYKNTPCYLYPLITKPGHPHWPQWLSRFLQIRPNTAVNQSSATRTPQKDNHFLPLCRITRVHLSPYPDRVFLLIHWDLHRLLYLWLHTSYPILLIVSDFILYREHFSVCNLDFPTMHHNHSAPKMFVWTQTWTSDTSHVPSLPEVAQSPCESGHLRGFWEGSIAYPYTLAARGQGDTPLQQKNASGIPWLL